MSIEQNKVEWISGQVIRSALAAGYVPTSDEVIFQIAEAIAQSDPTQPFYRHAPVTSLSPVVLAAGQDRVRTDIDLLLQTVYGIYEQVLEQDRRIQGERESQERRFQRLEAVLERLSLIQATPGYLSGYINAMTAISAFDGDHTTALIDIAGNRLCLPARQIALVSGCQSSLLTSSVQANGGLDSLTRSGTAIWRGTVTKTKATARTAAALKIQVVLTQAANRLQLDLAMLKPVTVTIEEGSRTDNYQHAYRTTTTGLLGCALRPETRYVRITLVKSEADKFDSAMDKAYYYYLIRQIRLFRLVHSGQATFQTKAIAVPDTASQLLFVAEDSRPAGTSLSYQASTDTATWFALRDGDILPMQTVSRQLGLEIANDSSLALATFRATGLDGSLYKLGVLAHPRVSNVLIYKGSNCWYEETLPISGTAGELTFRARFVKARQDAETSLATRYIANTTSGLTSLYLKTAVSPFQARALTTTVERAAARAETHRLTHNYPVMVCLNGKTLYSYTPATLVPVYADIVWPFVKGANTIEIYVQAGYYNDPASGEAAAARLTLDLGFVPAKDSSLAYVRLVRPVTLFELQYSLASQSGYALDSQGDETWVYMGAADVYVPHRIVYDTIDAINQTLYIRGDLGTADPDLTPEVRLLEVRYV
jgi:hypothetical protein